jgi:hypothetical protein
MDLLPRKEKNTKQAGLLSALKDFLHGNKERLDANNFNKEREALKDYSSITAREKLIIRKNDGILKKETPSNISSKPLEIPQTLENKEEEKRIETKSKVAEAIKSWEAPKILKTNLVQGEMTTFVDWRGNLKVLFYSCFSAVLLIVVVYVGLIIWEINKEKEGQELDAEIGVLKMNILKSVDDVKEIDTFQEKLKSAKALLATHIYWTNYFTFLENNLLSKIYLKGDFSGEPSGEYSFEATADDFEMLGKQIRHFEAQKEVKSIVVDGGKLSTFTDENKQDKTVLDFSMNLAVDPKIFFK